MDAAGVSFPTLDGSGGWEGVLIQRRRPEGGWVVFACPAWNNKAHVHGRVSIEPIYLRKVIKFRSIIRLPTPLASLRCSERITLSAWTT